MKKFLFLIIIFGAFMRFYAVNWDNYGAFHPDERNISWAVTRIKFFSQMDPKFFAYGGLPIYLYRALGEGVVFITKDKTWLYDWGHIAVIGRYVSATLSTASIFLIYLVGFLYFTGLTGLASAAFLAFSPWAIREAHFQTTETMLVFFLLLILLLAKTKKIFFLGIVWGMAMASKTTGALFGIIPLVVIWFPNIFKNIAKKFFFTLLLFTISLITFFLFSPYTILDFQHFRESMTYESGVALGRFSVPYTLQFFHTTPYLYQLVTMLWQAGPLVIVGLAGIIVMMVHKKYWAFLIFPVIYFGWVGSWYAKFSRYNVPFLPFITIAAAWLCVKIGKPFAALVLLTTAVWGLANFTVYLRPQTKVVATQWIAQHIPPDATIYTEHWNDGLPLDLPNMPQYHRELLTVYEEPDDAKKSVYYKEKLEHGDFIILSTRRIWATMPRLKEKYPVTSEFYKTLLAGELGYTEVASFTSYPQLFGITINDDSAEESVQVFDHPTVRIFKNNRLMSSMGS